MRPCVRDSGSHHTRESSPMNTKGLPTPSVTNACCSTDAGPEELTGRSPIDKFALGRNFSCCGYEQTEQGRPKERDGFRVLLQQPH